MARSKVAVSLDEQILQRLDGLVEEAVFPNRSQAIEVAVQEKLARLDQGRLARECAKLDPDFEKALAEEGFAEDAAAWPTY
ncbi:MAG: ribbon-helix-helix protein, CopG family [Nitrospira sp.]|nr:ribbon-helix-helix protein, CopG family [Nitrospira sp.]